MKFDIQLDNKAELNRFEILFFQNIGTEQNVYDFHADKLHLMMRVQISCIDGMQQTTMGLFSVTRVSNSVSIQQFPPLNDSRLKDLDIIKSVWASDPNWARIQCGQDEMGKILDTVYSLVSALSKIEKQIIL